MSGKKIVDGLNEAVAHAKIERIMDSEAVGSWLSSDYALFKQRVIPAVLALLLVEGRGSARASPSLLDAARHSSGAGAEPSADERDPFEEWAEADHRDLAPEWNEDRTPDNGLYYICDTTNAAYIGWRERAARCIAPASPAERSALPRDHVPSPPDAEWRPIETAPERQNILLAAWRSDPPDWLIASGWKRPGEPPESYTPWNFDGAHLRIWDHQPTHWQPLPSPPDGGSEGSSISSSSGSRCFATETDTPSHSGKGEP